MHGWGGSQRRGIGRGKRLVQHGFVGLTFNMRGHGRTRSQKETVTRAQNLDDVVHAYDYLAQQDGVDRERIGVVGSSYGGYLAALLTERRAVRWPRREHHVERRGRGPCGRFGPGLRLLEEVREEVEDASALVRPQGGVRGETVEEDGAREQPRLVREDEIDHRRVPLRGQDVHRVVPDRRVEGDDLRERLAAMGYQKVHVRSGDGYGGWQEAAPFAAIDSLIAASTRTTSAPTSA